MVRRTEKDEGTITRHAAEHNAQGGHTVEQKTDKILYHGGGLSGWSVRGSVFGIRSIGIHAGWLGGFLVNSFLNASTTWRNAGEPGEQVWPAEI